MKKLNVDLINDPIIRAIALFALPILISYFFQQLYNAVDTMVVGKFLGEMSLAAIGACAVVFQLLVGFTFGISSGMSIVVSRYFGSGDEEMIKKSVAASIIIGFGFVAVLTFASEFFLYGLLRLLNTPAGIIDEAYQYIHVIILFLVLMFAYNFCAGMLRAIGNSIMPLMFLIFSSVLNIGLDLLFIIKFGMGIKGAAVATVMSQAISAVLCIIYIFKKAHILIPKPHHFKINTKIYIDLISHGLSMAMMGSIVVLGSVILQYSINSLGPMIIAGHTTARRLFFFCIMPVVALGITMPTFVSQNKGANKIDRILKGANYSMIFGVLWGIVCAVLILFAAKPLVMFISSSSNQVLVDTGTKYLIFNIAFIFVLGMLNVTRYALQGLGSKVIPLVSSTIELVAKVLFVLFVIPSMGYWGVIISEPVIWIIMTVYLMFAFYRNRDIRGYRHQLERS